MSSREDWGLCSPEEYQGGRTAPLERGDLSIGESYTWMVSLGGDDAGRQRSIIEGIETYDTELGLYVVWFATIGASAEPKPPKVSVFQGGLFQKREERDMPLYFDIPGGLQARVHEGYFQESDDDSGGGPDESGDDIPGGLARLEEYANKGPEAPRMVGLPPIVGAVTVPRS